MATYQNRVTELRDALAQVAVGVDERILKALSQCLDQYADLRQRALDDLYDLIAKASAGNAETPRKWQTRITAVRGQLNRLFGDSVKDLMLPPSIQLFWATAWQAEENFFSQLDRVNTPQHLDDLLSHQARLSKMIAELQDGWKFFLSNDQTLENDQIRTIKQLDEMVQHILAELDSWQRALIDHAASLEEAVKRKAEQLKTDLKEKLGAAGEWIAAGFKLAKEFILEQLKPEGLPDDINTQIEASKQQMEMAKEILVAEIRLYRSLVESYQAMVKLENGGVLTMFNKTRRETDDYIKNNDLAKAATWRDQARGQLSDWVNALATARQRDDAGSFRDEVYKVIDATFAVSQTLDADFRKQFQGVFLSPLSNETIETLAERYLFEQHLQTLNSRGGAAKLRDYRSQLPEQASRLDRSFDHFDHASNDLPPEVRELITLRNKEFKTFVRERIKRQIELLLPAIDDLRTMLEPSNVQRDFSREELIRSLQ